MSVNRPIEIDANGNLKEIVPLAASAGVADANKLVQTDSNGLLDPSFFPAGFGDDVENMPSFVNLAAGEFVNIFLDTGVAKARLADASDISTRADGFVLDGVTAPAAVNVYRRGLNNALAGLTIGSRYFLSTTPGDVTTTAPSGDGEIVQEIGVATTATAIDFERTRPVIKTA